MRGWRNFPIYLGRYYFCTKSPIIMRLRGSIFVPFPFASPFFSDQDQMEVSFFSEDSSPHSASKGSHRLRREDSSFLPMESLYCRSRCVHRDERMSNEMGRDKLQLIWMGSQAMDNEFGIPPRESIWTLWYGPDDPSDGRFFFLWKNQHWTLWFGSEW